MNQQKPKTQTKMERNETVRGNPLRDLPEWLEEFTENLVDESVPAHRDAPASSSRESASESRGKVVSGKHRIYTHFPKDRSCEICKRTKITRAPFRKRTGAAVLRAEHFGGLITADHKVLCAGCESRNNHRYAVVVQDMATQWLQSYPCRTKTSQGTEKTGSCSRRGNQKSFTLTIPKNLAKLVRIYLGIVVRQHLTVQKQIGLLRVLNDGATMSRPAGRKTRGRMAAVLNCVPL